MNIKRNILFLAFFTPAVVLAEDSPVESGNLLQPRFQFQHQTINLGTGLQAEEGGSSQVQLFDPDNSHTGRVKQYDATIAYPFGSDKTFNFDLGINLRLIDADLKTQTEQQQSRRFNAALPMFYANALINLPFDGLSASVGGSHFEYEQYRAYDYRAKLSYSWQNGFGLEGGWQHQQFQIDGSDFNTQFETKGPFLDLKYRF